MNNQIKKLKKSYDKFWKWFQKNEQALFLDVKMGKSLEEEFIEKIHQKLRLIHEEIYFYARMHDNTKAEIIFTAFGEIEVIVFIEQLMTFAPKLDSWLFTYFKPSHGFFELHETIYGIRLDTTKLSFYANIHLNFPDEIDLMIVYADLPEENSDELKRSIYHFLDSYIGELEMLFYVDRITVISKKEAQQELIPIQKLQSYLKWRIAEFIEKYEGFTFDIKNYQFEISTEELPNGNIRFTQVNSPLYDWEGKASHPWMAVLIFKYDGSKNNGLPNDEDLEAMQLIDIELQMYIVVTKGIVQIGRHTANGVSELFFACKNFRIISLYFYALQQKYKNKYDLDFHIYKDKYWRSYVREYKKGGV